MCGYLYRTCCLKPVISNSRRGYYHKGQPHVCLGLLVHRRRCTFVELVQRHRRVAIGAQTRPARLCHKSHSHRLGTQGVVMESRQFCREETPIPFFPTLCTEALGGPQRSTSSRLAALPSAHGKAGLNACENASASDPPMQYHLPVQQNTKTNDSENANREKSRRSR